MNDPKLTEHEIVRKDLFDFISRELVGPHEDEEELLSPPHLDYYIAGILYPQLSKEIPHEEADNIVNDGSGLDSEAEDQENYDSTESELEKKIYSLSSAYMPSSMGFSCKITKDYHGKILYAIEFAQYMHYRKTEISLGQENKSSKSGVWKRKASKIDGVIDISALTGGKLEKKVFDNLRLLVLYKKETGYFTASLVNESCVLESSEGKSVVNEIAEKSFYQVSLKISGEKNKKIFIPRNFYDSHDDEERKFEILFQKKQTFAIGHGCSASWDSASTTTTDSVWTSVMPVVQVQRVDFDQNLDDETKKALDMKFLSKEGISEKELSLQALGKLCDSYEEWINKLKKTQSKFNAEFIKITSRNIEECQISLSRIQKGVQALRDDDKAWDAFSLMNRAMAYQQTGQDPAENETIGASVWRPFQLAFILINIEGLINPKSSDRNIVDLLWFPTGGGKTEAYLGIIAFTIFYRRLYYGKDGGGTAAIMRYTLRLLTSQQMQRATRLICACEIIRTKVGRKMGGDEKISSGIWVGSEITPNTTTDYNNKLEDANEYSPIIQQCPWCKTSIRPIKYEARKKDIFLYKCMNKECEFKNGIPMLFIDEIIYKNPPTLIIGTVDKFVAITTRADQDNAAKDAARIFAANKYNNNIQPSLIIQDELHLISGALGTMVGLFETVVEEICSIKGVSPKIIASTATIRGAKEQCRNLFQRKVIQFPSAGLSIEDSYFGVESPITDRSRLYVGIQASGHTLTTTEIRVISAIIQGVHYLGEQYNVAAKDPKNQGERFTDPNKYLDPYWTLIAYFNSIKELGKCSSLVDQDIKIRMDAIARRNKLIQPRYIGDNGLREMTGSRKTKDIGTILDELFYELKSGRALDLVLTTNMFSVGVDVPRLGIMLVTTQPKSNAEYIQATSRVGRNFPGMIFTIYDFSRSRDRSYYENFVGYHKAFYRHVEASSITPFSPAAIERGIKTMIIALIRNRFREDGVSNTLDSSMIGKGKFLDVIKAVILERVKKADDSNIEEATEIIDRTLDELKEIVRSVTSVKFDELIYRFNPITRNKITPQQWELLTSMRNVDKNSVIRAYTYNVGGDPDLFGDTSKNCVRKSQLIVPFGPGSIVDLENNKSVILGQWGTSGIGFSGTIDERFLNRLSGREFIAPPTEKDEKAINGLLFPEWGYCRKCKLFGKIIKLFHLINNKWVCGCGRYGKSRVIQIKYLTVCLNGHISDVPWDILVHAGKVDYFNDNKAHEIKYCSFGETGGIGEEGLKCSCGKYLSFARLKQEVKKLKCQGKTFLNFFKNQQKQCDCGVELKHKGASSVYFPIVRSSLYMPSEGCPKITKVVRELVATFEDGSNELSEDKKREIVEIWLKKEGVPKEAAWSLYQKHCEPADLAEVTNTAEEIEYRRKEYLVLSAQEDRESFTQDLVFTMIPREELSKYYPKSVIDVKLVSILKETRAILGYTRVFPQGLQEDGQAAASQGQMVHVIGKDRKIPAIEVRGEGIFFRLDAHLMNEWVKSNPEIKERIIRLHKQNELTKRKYGIAVQSVTPGFVLLHTLSHLLIRRLGLECGYNTASLRERIYYSENKGSVDMCGLLIYTASGDADGTLGGLVRSGRKDRFPVFFNNAIRSSEWCSSDPLCMESGGQGRDSLNLAACHACTLLPETSCEFQNVYLDRGLLIGIPDSKKEIGFFKIYK